MSFRMSCIVLFIAVVAGPRSSAAERVLRETTAVDFSPMMSFHAGETHGTVGLRVSPGRTLPGEPIEVVVSIANRGTSPLSIFNAPLSGLADRYAEVAMFDARGTYLGDLLRIGGSKGPPPDHLAWCHLPPRSIHEVGFNFKAGAFNEAGLVTLPPGRYLFQVIVRRTMFSESPWDLPYYECGVNKASRSHAEFVAEVQRLMRVQTGKSPEQAWQDWAKANPPGELARSNVVELLILPRPVEAEKPD